MNVTLIIVQLIVNVLYGLLKKPIGRKFKIFALVFFPLLSVLLPIIPIALLILKMEGAPDATAISMPVLIPIGFELSGWLLQILLALIIQLFFNYQGFKLLRSFRK